MKIAGDPGWLLTLARRMNEATESNLVNQRFTTCQLKIPAGADIIIKIPA